MRRAGHHGLPTHRQAARVGPEDMLGTARTDIFCHRAQRIPAPTRPRIHTKEARRAQMIFHCTSWETDPAKAVIELRRGCSASPILVRCFLQDCLDPLHDAWDRPDLGQRVDDQRLAALHGPTMRGCSARVQWRSTTSYEMTSERQHTRPVC